jgi:membrane protease YdiL (CAAX protease family)
MSAHSSSTPTSFTGTRPLWGVLEAILVGFFGSFAVHISVAVMMSMLFGPSSLRRISIQLAAGVLSVGLCYLVARLYHQSWPALGLRKSRPGAWKGIVLADITYVVIGTVVFALVRVLLPEFNLDEVQNIGFEDTDNILTLVVIFVTVVLMPAVFEEVIYRGFIFGGLQAHTGFWPAAIISSLLFGLAHMQLNVGIDTFFLGLASCWLYARYHSLLSSIGLHVLKNSTAFVLLFVI